MTSLTTPKETGRGADIPAPRGGQGVRLLVLGGDEDARLLRERAAAAGFELAQRYSARVSHVAYGAGVDPQDGRYAKIRDAGLALLPIQACAAELGLAKPAKPAKPAESPVPAQAEPRLEERQPARERNREPEPEPDEVPEDDLLDQPGGPDPLAYPPLPEEEPNEPGPEELDPTAVALAAAAIGADRWPTDFEVVEISEMTEISEISEVVTETVIEVGETSETVETEPDGVAGEAAEITGVADVVADDEALEDVAILEEAALAEAIVEGESVEPEPEPADAATPRPRLLVLSVVWALIPLISLGLLTPLVFGYAAIRTRSRLYAAATVGYALAVLLAFALSAEHPQPGSTANGTGGLLTFALALSWLGGTGHALTARTRVFGG